MKLQLADHSIDTDTHCVDCLQLKTECICKVESIQQPVWKKE